MGTGWWVAPVDTTAGLIRTNRAAAGLGTLKAPHPARQQPDGM
jgi:hypothetical protein